MTYFFPVAPLFVVEFLHRVVDTFDDYFSECTESIIKEHYVVVYEVKSVSTHIDFQYKLFKFCFSSWTRC